jgi:hypothetical protein
VHHADRFAAKLRRRLRLERDVGLLRYRQRVHVRAQADGATRFPAAQETDHARHADAGFRLDAERAQMLGDLFCGTHFPVAELRVRVEVAPPFDGFRLDGLRGRVELGAGNAAVGGAGRGGNCQRREEKSGQSAVHAEGPSYGQERYRAMMIAISPRWGNPLQSTGFWG